MNVSCLSSCKMNLTFYFFIHCNIKKGRFCLRLVCICIVALNLICMITTLEGSWGWPEQSRSNNILVNKSQVPQEFRGPRDPGHTQSAHWRLGEYDHEGKWWIQRENTSWTCVGYRNYHATNNEQPCVTLGEEKEIRSRNGSTNKLAGDSSQALCLH